MHPATTKPERGIPAPTERRDIRTESYTAAGLVFASQALHMWGLQEQFLFRPLTGGLMFLVAVLQGILVAGLLFGPGRRMLRYGIALNTCVVSSWILTRFFGHPGLLGFERLPVEPTNLAIPACGLAAIWLLVRIHRRKGEQRNGS